MMKRQKVKASSDNALAVAKQPKEEKKGNSKPEFSATNDPPKEFLRDDHSNGHSTNG